MAGDIIRPKFNSLSILSDFYSLSVKLNPKPICSINLEKKALGKKKSTLNLEKTAPATGYSLIFNECHVIS